MATKEHKECAQLLKDVHSSLRKLSNKYGHDVAWTKHCSEEETLKQYANAMKLLGSQHWEKNAADPRKSATSRISWVVDYCSKYYFSGGLSNSRQKELKIADKLNTPCSIDTFPTVNKTLKVLDVGSCYNPFRLYPFMEVLPIDLYPASDSDVFECDFLTVKIDEEIIIDNQTVHQLSKDTYDVVVFSLLLEYLPVSEQRKLCCKKAFNLLKLEGILIIITPDSKHVGANAKIMKNWRYTLALMGFSRITYEKLPYLHCMTFRKCLDPIISRRWADIYKEPYMGDEIAIPQDRHASADELDDVESLNLKDSFAHSSAEDTLQMFCNLPNDLS